MINRTANLISYLLLIAALSTFLSILYTSAWVTDDAYITFRTVDNVVNGYGLTWNTNERVQSFTNPLWMFVMIIPYWIVGEIYYTSMAVQMVLTMTAALLLGFVIARNRLLGFSAICLLGLSKAFIDYSSSGLENPLTHFLLALFYIVYFRFRESQYYVAWLSSLMALVALTRLDNVLLVIVPMGYILLQEYNLKRVQSAIFQVFFGLIPLIAWELFSLFYYGFLFPNTAYSKLNSQLPLMEYLERGFFYLVNSWIIDPVTLLTILLGISAPIVAWKIANDRRFIPVAIGIVLSIIYIIRVGGDHMSGRYLTAPLFVAVVLITQLPLDGRRLIGSCAGFLAVIIGISIFAQFPTLGDRYMTRFRRSEDGHDIADARRISFPHTGLRNARKFETMPNHRWAKRGKKLRRTKQKFVKCGGIGFTGFFAGPDVYVLDQYALSDALLARLPHEKPKKAYRKPNQAYRYKGWKWRVGHIDRRVPRGYKKTLQTGTNHIEDDDLANYYDKLRSVIRGDLWDIGRFGTIIELNLGFFDHWLEAYKKRAGY